MSLVLGFVLHGARFLSILVPPGTPAWLLPLMVPIEMISYLVRPFSLSVRLFANMMAGHTMLKVFAGFVVVLGVFGIAPFLFTVAFTALEFAVAVLQAFIFAVLTCLYLSDAINMHEH
jgi:F-type H+-transporting ATPase subunit a